jgi:hypothetical protein
MNHKEVVRFWSRWPGLRCYPMRRFCSDNGESVDVLMVGKFNNEHLLWVDTVQGAT